MQKKLAVQTCIGTEAPLTVPKAVKKRLNITGEPDKETIESLYEGMFERIKRTHPLDYYWLWTPEDWTWLGNTKEDTEKTIRDFACALEAKEKTEAPFELAVCGWTLGPRKTGRHSIITCQKVYPFHASTEMWDLIPLNPNSGI